MEYDRHIGLDAGGVRMSKTQSLPSKCFQSRGRNIHIPLDPILRYLDAHTYKHTHPYTHITYTHSYTNTPSTHTLSHTHAHLYVKILIHTQRVWELTKWRP